MEAKQSVDLVEADVSYFKSYSQRFCNQSKKTKVSIS